MRNNSGTWHLTEARDSNTLTMTHEGGSSAVNANVTTSSWLSLVERPLPQFLLQVPEIQPAYTIRCGPLHPALLPHSLVSLCHWNNYNQRGPDISMSLDHRVGESLYGP